MSKHITQYLDQHQYPQMFFRFPILVHFVYAINYVLTLRNWYVRRALRMLEKKQPAGFMFLDAGCGMGEFALGVARRNSHALVSGIDFTASNIPLAKHIAQSMNLPNTEFTAADLSTLHTDNRYDLILCNSVLQFIQEDTLALRNLHGMLKPTGTLLLYVPVRYYRYFKLSEVIEKKYLSDFFYRYHDDFLMHRYTEENLFEKIRKEGFSIRSSEHAYGVCGALAFELYSFILALVKKMPVAVSLFIVLVYTILILPIQLLLMLVDYLLPKSIGNGVLIIAEKDLERVRADL